MSFKGDFKNLNYNKNKKGKTLFDVNNKFNNQSSLTNGDHGGSVLVAISASNQVLAST